MAEPSSPSAPRRVPDALWLVLVVSIVVGLVWTAPLAAQRNADFVHLWLGGHALVEAGTAALYDPLAQLGLLESALGGAVPDDLWAERNDRIGAFFYPPPAALVYAPLGLLALPTAATVQPLISLLCFGLAGLLLSRWTGLSRLPALAATLWMPAALHSHVLGQNGGLALLVLAAAGLALHERRALLGGALLGLLAAKPSWWVAVAWVPLVLEPRRTVPGFALGTAGVVLGSAVLLGVQPWADWLALAPDIARLDTLPGYPLDLQYSLPGLGRRLVAGPGGAWLGRGLALLVLGIGALRTLRLREDLPHALALALCTATLTSPHAHAYDLVGALPGLLLLGARRGLSPVVVAVALAHHGGQALEGGAGTGWALPPATVGLIGVWMVLVDGRYLAPPSPSRS